MTTIEVQISVDVVNSQLLRDYTSGFMPTTASLGARVTEILVTGGHPIHPRLNGLAIVEHSYKEES